MLSSRFFEKHPEARPLFAAHGVDDLSSIEFRSHALRVAAGLGTVINLALDSATLHEQLEWLGEFHAKIEGMNAEFFLVSLPRLLFAQSELYYILHAVFFFVFSRS